MKKYLRYLGPVLITALFVLAIYLLYHKLKAYSIAQIRESIQQVSTGSICFSIGLMIVNYIILVGYDWLALKAIHKSLPLPRVGLVSLVGQAVSYNFGALLGGTSVRYRFYSAWGFSLAEIVRLVLMLAVTFWVGALGLCGVVFLLAPPVIPDELLAKMPIHDVRFLGGILLAIALSYLVLCFTIRKPVHVFGKEFVFPVPRIAVAQMVVAGVDLIAAAACMYVLLPGDLGIGFIDFLPSYLMAQVAVVLTHVPGGVGVFELVILHLTHTPREQAVFAAVLLFRLIYFILPLLAAAALLAVYEARQSRNTLREAGRWLSVLSHSIAAYTTFVGGCILLVSAMLPTLPAVVAQLDFLPRPLLMGGIWSARFPGPAALCGLWTGAAPEPCLLDGGDPAAAGHSRGPAQGAVLPGGRGRPGGADNGLALPAPLLPLFLLLGRSHPRALAGPRLRGPGPGHGPGLVHLPSCVGQGRPVGL